MTFLSERSGDKKGDFWSERSCCIGNLALATLLFTFIQARLKFRKAHPPSREYLDQKIFVDTSAVDYGCIWVKIIWYKEVKIIAYRRSSLKFIAHLDRSSLNLLYGFFHV